MAEKRLSIFFFRLIPTRLLSRIFGLAAALPLPGPVMRRLIRWYSGKFGVIDEYVTPEKGFGSVNEFFTRELKPGSRPVDPSPDAVVSPVDARVDQYGKIDGATLIQAKGIRYTLDALIPSKESEKFRDGDFMTLYLSPGDYHRIHSPVQGTITGFYAIPGALFTVQEYMVRGLEGLFCKNERLITYIDSEVGPVAVCKIGAMNVGKMTLSYPVKSAGKASRVVTNRAFTRAGETIFSGEERIRVRAGDELGRFNLGSTVILLFGKNAVRFADFALGSRVKVGGMIGKKI